VNEVVDSSGVRYAVIAGLRTETGTERLVIAYSNEESVRDLIATPSIIALGFSSREEAVAGRATVPVPSAVAYQRMPKAIAGKEIERPPKGRSWADGRSEGGSILQKLAKLFVTSYSNIATAAMVIFSSTNAISAVIRMALGSSGVNMWTDSARTTLYLSSDTGEHSL
jgi:hypothetical protein